jgi:GTPase
VEETQKDIHNKKIKLCENIDDIETLNPDQIASVVISNCSGDNIHIIKHLLKKITVDETNIPTDEHMCEFMINDVFFVNDVGVVVSGVVNNGKIKIGDKLLIGPISKTFYNVSIKSIHKKQIPCKCLTKNEIGSLVIKTDSNIVITKNLTIFSSDQFLNFINKFKISILKENYSEIKKDSCLMIFSKNIYDCINIDSVEETSDAFIVNARFQNSNIQFLSPNELIVIRQNSTILIGKLAL